MGSGIKGTGLGVDESIAAGVQQNAGRNGRSNEDGWAGGLDLNSERGQIHASHARSYIAEFVTNILARETFLQF